jgi:hypothetical protein
MSFARRPRFPQKADCQPDADIGVPTPTVWVTTPDLNADSEEDFCRNRGATLLKPVTVFTWQQVSLTQLTLTR